MAWEWSHTPEAYQNAYENLAELDTETLKTINAEWLAYHVGKEEDPETSEPFNQDAYNHALTTEPDIDTIWIDVEELATCDNGGFNAWVCPYGCHTVPFSEEAN